MSNEKNRGPVTTIGLSSLLIIFLVLSLTTFALLALSTAKSDHALSQKLAEHRTDYYTTSSKAEVILDKIDRMLEEDTDTLLKQQEFTIDDTQITVCTEDGISYLSYTVPQKNGQELFVKLQITSAETADHYYEILAWQVNHN